LKRQHTKNMRVIITLSKILAIDFVSSVVAIQQQKESVEICHIGTEIQRIQIPIYAINVF